MLDVLGLNGEKLTFHDSGRAYRGLAVMEAVALETAASRTAGAGAALSGEQLQLQFTSLTETLRLDSVGYHKYADCGKWSRQSFGGAKVHE